MAIHDTVPGTRANLASLQAIALLQARVAERLATGLRVNRAEDDPSAHFVARDHRNRVGDLGVRKDQMGEAVRTVETALRGIDGIARLLEQARELATSARASDAAGRAAHAAQFDALRRQVDELAGDAGYKGTNLLRAAGLKVIFDEAGASAVSITGFDATSAGLAVAPAANAWAADADLDAATAELDTALGTLRGRAAALAADAGVVKSGLDFTVRVIDALSAGADLLTAADTSEEAAALLALQTRQQLALSALRVTGESRQGLLRLF